jgi:thioredoxin 1
MQDMLRRLLSAAVLGAAVVLAGALRVEAAQPYDAKAFNDAKAAGKTILIDVFASWCPVCKKQQPTVERIEKERPNLVVYRVDFDTAKDVLKSLRVQSQGTLIVFKGQQEVGRLTMDPDAGRIRALVAKGF